MGDSSGNALGGEEPGKRDDGGHTRASLGDGLLESIVEWALPAIGWDVVATLLDQLHSAHTSGDHMAASAVRRDLTRIGYQEARRLGDDQGAGASRQPIPRRVRQRVNILVHDLGVPVPGERSRPVIADRPAPADNSGQRRGAEVTGDEGRGARHESRRAEAGPSSRRFFTLSMFDRTRVAWASTGDNAPQPLGDEVTVAGLRVVRLSTSRSLVELLVLADGTGQDGDVVEARVGSGDRLETYLLPLWRDPVGCLVGSVEIATHQPQLEFHVTAPFPASLLDGGDADAVRRSVAASSRSGRNSWRAIARVRSASDTVHIAVLEGLR